MGPLNDPYNHNDKLRLLLWDSVLCSDISFSAFLILSPRAGCISPFFSWVIMLSAFDVFGCEESSWAAAPLTSHSGITLPFWLERIAINSLVSFNTSLPLLVPAFHYIPRQFTLFFYAMQKTLTKRRVVRPVKSKRTEWKILEFYSEPQHRKCL